MGKTSHPKIRYDWYESESSVVINILEKNLRPENVRVELIHEKLSCYAKLADDSDYFLHLNLAHEVSGQELKYKVFPSKIEIRLKKSQAKHWSKLEASEDEVQFRKENIRKYPSSKASSTDWDKMVSEIKKEEESSKDLDGEAALNHLFQKIYAEGTDETKKAMNKSYMESGGTVLSTSWNEVSKKTIEAKPPSGMEFKKWD